MTVKNAICQGKVRTIEDAVEAWKADHTNAMQVRAIEDLVDASLDLFDFACSWEKQAIQDLFADRVEQVYKTGEDLRACLNRSSDLAGQIEDCIHEAESHGYRVDRTGDFRQAVNDLKRVRADFLHRWPFIDPKQVEEARADFAAGRYKTGEEILRELEGQRPE